MEAKHTPAPWVTFADKGAAVCIMPAMRPGEICSFEGCWLPEREANANLIAAAPDLLAALKDLLEGATYVALKAADAAIAKAEGQP